MHRTEAEAEVVRYQQRQASTNKSGGFATYRQADPIPRGAFTEEDRWDKAMPEDLAPANTFTGDGNETTGEWEEVLGSNLQRSQSKDDLVY